MREIHIYRGDQLVVVLAFTSGPNTKVSIRSPLTSRDEVLDTSIAALVTIAEEQFPGDGPVRINISPPAPQTEN